MANVMEKVKVVINNEQREVKIPTGLRMIIRRCCVAVIQIERLNVPATVTVAFVDNERIRELNSKYRKKDCATDVLSFPSGTDGNYVVDEATGVTNLGDIAICIETALAQAKEHGCSLQEEVSFLTVHSMLHLFFFYYDAGPEEEEKMKDRETLIMSKLGYVSVPGHRCGI